MSEHRNLLWALVLSLGVLLAWDFWQRPAEESGTVQSEAGVAEAQSKQSPALPFLESSGARGAAAERIAIANPRLSGSISLFGGRFDDIILTTYGETPDPQSPRIRLFTPDAYFAEFIYQRAGASETPLIFRAETTHSLAPDRPVRLIADLGGGLILRREISLDEAYLFTIRDEIRNQSGGDALITPNASLWRQGTPEISGYFLLHEGPIGVFSQSGLEEVDYDDVLPAASAESFASRGGYLGFTDKYWASALIIPPEDEISAQFTRFPDSASDFLYRASFSATPLILPPGGSKVLEYHLFVGAKEVALLDGYAENLPAPQLDLLINWGWFYFLTKPFFHFLHWLFQLTGNFGTAILLATVFVKLAFFPLANMSYAALAQLRRIQPEIEALRERYGDDRAKRDQALMTLYRESGANPAAGCLPLLIQIPVFFAIYKVLFVTIEMRHTPFYGWIEDLAAPDPTSLFNVFGLLPISLPDFMIIGIWPLLMGATMWIQMQLNPPPPDPVQRRMFALFPLIITVVLARFPAGLVIYWAWNNLLSILQQAYIMKRHGAEFALLNNVMRLWKKPDKENPEKPEEKSGEK